MKVLRASPASFFVAASALHCFMRSCGVVALVSVALHDHTAPPLTDGCDLSAI